MMNHTSRLLIGFAVLTFLVTAHSANGELTYSWSGTLFLNGASDPWNLGSQGSSFSLSVSVSDLAVDMLPGNTDFAAFAIDDARLIVGAQTIPYVANGVLDFTDNEAGTTDIVTFNGDFDKLGNLVEIGSNAALPLSTFQFQNSSEKPPYFASANVDQTSGCCGGIYGSVVPAGALVTVVPEPTTLTLLTFSIFAWNCRRIRRHTNNLNVLI
jgi:hypothetical protein